MLDLEVNPALQHPRGGLLPRCPGCRASHAPRGVALAPDQQPGRGLLGGGVSQVPWGPSGLRSLLGCGRRVPPAPPGPSAVSSGWGRLLVPVPHHQASPISRGAALRSLPSSVWPAAPGGLSTPPVSAASQLFGVWPPHPRGPPWGPGRPGHTVWAGAGAGCWRASEGGVAAHLEADSRGLVAVHGQRGGGVERPEHGAAEEVPGHRGELLRHRGLRAGAHVLAVEPGGHSAADGRPAGSGGLWGPCRLLPAQCPGPLHAGRGSALACRGPGHSQGLTSDSVTVTGTSRVPAYSKNQPGFWQWSPGSPRQCLGSL